MSAAARVTAFVALLATIFGAATVAGGAVDPDTDSRADAHGAAQGAAAGHAHAGTGQSGRGAPDGLSVADGTYRLQADRTRFAAGRPARLTFRIVDARGATKRDFDVEQARRMHLIVVRRELRGYQHLHPTQAKDGSWSVPLTLPQAGAYRAFADFRTGGQQHVLGIDLLVPGRFAPHALPPAAAVARVDGYEVAMHTHAGGEIGFAVRRDGAPVTDLQPYLGALGHLAALRDGDLAYRHAHPVRAGSTGEISFEGVTLAPARYRLFLQFRHSGGVHTAAFTHEVTR